MRVVEPGDATFEALWPNLLTHHGNPTASISDSHFKFRAAYLGERLQSRYRCLVVDGDKPAAGSSFDLIDGVLDAAAVPSAFIVARGIDDERRTAAEDLLNREIDGLCGRYNASGIRFIDQKQFGDVSRLSRWAIDRGARSEPQPVQIIDLRQDDAALRHDMTKSCRWGINWGGKNMQVAIRDDREAFDELRRLHRLAAGGDTRSDETWDIQFRMIQNDEAFLIISTLAGTVVSASLFQLSADDCLYGVAASDRRLFEERKPIGHASMWEAMRYAKQRGRVRFVVGVQKWTNEKEANIAKFKRSFGGHLVEELLIELRAQGA